ncbi:MAG: DUF1700 domain-containing protein [Clostridia bacterium]|nr:DUF1700 domain-containing protein [Clostridia bacterium]
MDKREFIEKLCAELTGLPYLETEERVNFYREMIDDRMEEGLTEEEAVGEIGNPADIAAQIIAEHFVPEEESAPDEKTKRKFATWEIVLLVLGAPIWVSLAAAVVSVAFALYAVIWSVVVSLWAAAFAAAASFLGGLVSAVHFAVKGNGIQGLCIFGCALICAGVSILLCILNKYVTDSIIQLTKKCAVSVREKFAKRRAKL